MTIQDLLTLGLQPREFMVACYLLTREYDGVIRATTEEVATVLDSGYSTAARSLALLVERGVFDRPARGVFIPRELSVGRVSGPELSVERDLKYVQQSIKPINRYVSVDDPNGSSTLGASALKGISIVNRYDYESEGNDISVVGIDGPPPAPAKKPDRKRNLKYHRTVPREKWDEAFVSKEFRHRMTMERPDIRDVGVDSRSLILALREFRKTYAVSVSTMATAVDMFFDKGRAASLSVDDVPYKRFLAYLLDHVRGIEDMHVTPADQKASRDAWEAILNG